jgi:hypothetical protein
LPERFLGDDASFPDCDTTVINGHMRRLKLQEDYAAK